MKKIFVWLLVIIVFQLSIYTYLDRILLVPAVSFTQNVVDKYQKNGITYSSSYDGLYVAHISKTGIKIFQSKAKNSKYSLKLASNESISYFTWLPDRDLALAGINKDRSYSTTIILKPINLQTQSKPVEPVIKGLKKYTRIVDVAFSSSTNVLYMHLSGPNGSRVYRVDANNIIRREAAVSRYIGKIDSLKNQDVLVFDNTMKNAVYVLKKGSVKRISPPSGQYALIGIDKVDNIYIGRLKNNSINEIMIGRINKKFSVLKKMPGKYKEDSLMVTYDGRIKLTSPKMI